MKRIVEKTIFITISLWGIISLGSSSPQSLGDYEEFLSPRSSEAEKLKEDISSSLKRTKSLPEARERFLELQQEIKLTHPDKITGHQEELLNHLQDAYAQHLRTTPLVINGDKSSLSADKLLQVYTDLEEKLRTLIANPIIRKARKQPLKKSSSPRPHHAPQKTYSLQDHLTTLDQVNKDLIHSQPYHEHLAQDSDIKQQLDRARTQVTKLYDTASAAIEHTKKKDLTRPYGMTPVYEKEIQGLNQQEARAEAEFQVNQKKLAKKSYLFAKQRTADLEKLETAWLSQKDQSQKDKIKILVENMGNIIQHLLDIKTHAQQEYDDQTFKDDDATIEIIEDLLSVACPYMTEQELTSARNTLTFFEDKLSISLINQTRDLISRGGFIHDLIVNSNMEHKTTYLPRRNTTIRLVMEELKKLVLIAQTPDEEEIS